ERMVANLEAYGRRYLFPRIVPGRAEDFFREVERRWGTTLPVRRGDTGLYWEDGAASTAAELAWFRRAQLAARAAGVLALWDDRVEPDDDGKAGRIAARAAERRAMWRDLLLFGEHTWGADVSVTEPEARQTVAQGTYKRRFLEGGAAAAESQVAEGPLRLGRATPQGPDGNERVKTSAWSGLNQLVYAKGGEHSALWTYWDRKELATAPQLDVAQARLKRARRERLPGIGVRLVAERQLAGFPAVTST